MRRLRPDFRRVGTALAIRMEGLAMLIPGPVVPLHARTLLVSGGSRRGLKRGFSRALLASATFACFAAPVSSAGPDAARGAAWTQHAAPYVVRLHGPSLWDVHQTQLARLADVSQGAEAVRRNELGLLQVAYGQRLAALAPALAAMGAEVTSPLEAVAFGFLIRATPAVAAAVAARPDIESVTLAPVLAPATHGVNRASASMQGDPRFGVASGVAPAVAADGPDPFGASAPAPERSLVVPQIGAPRVWQDLGLNGDDVLVAILDTGIDYTHKDFGGPGTLAAYTNNNEDRVESGTFPTRQVVGGYDLAGQYYSPHPSCIQPNPPGQVCNRAPDPDDDPLDSRGNGTYVAGIVAGQGLDGLQRGVAPGARLVSLKIFGNPIQGPVVTELMPAAFDWVFLNNLELDLPGWPTDPIQVIDMSLTSAWLGGADETRTLIREANEAGITVVVASGNEGQVPYFMGALAGAETALTVGATWPNGQGGLEYNATWTDAGGTDFSLAGLAMDTRIVGQITTASRPIDGDVAYVGEACPGTALLQPARGKVALIARGTCSFAEKVAAVVDAGATSAVIFTEEDLPVQELGGTGSFPIPGAMIPYTPGQRLSEAALAGRTARIRVELPVDFDVLGGTVGAVANFSTRGPTRFSPGVKPQLVAPGLRVTSTAVGTGDGVVNQSGTSIAASAAAGAAALVWERNLKRTLGLTAADVAALLTNHASPDVRVEHSRVGPQAPIGNRGAGFLNAYTAARANTLVRTEHGLAEVDLGLLHLTGEPLDRTETFTVTNLGPAPRTYAISARLLFPDEDADHGVDVSVTPTSLTVPAGDSRTAVVHLRVVPDELREWTLYGVEAATRPDLVQVMEVDGLLEVIETDGAMPKPDGDHVVIPFVNLSVRHSCIRSVTNATIVVGNPGDRVPQRYDNPCPTPGWVNQYVLVAEDASEPNIPAALDIVSVGFRRYLADPLDPDSDVIVEWAIQTRGPRRTPAAAQFRIYIDVDEDGAFESVIYNLEAGELSRFVEQDFELGRWLNAQGPVIPDTLEPDNFGIRTWTYQPYQLDETTTVLIASADEMGIDLRSPTTAFRFGVAAVDASGDYPLTAEFTGQDLAPDGLSPDGAQTFRYDTRAHDCMLFDPRVDVPGNGSADVGLEMYCEDPDREAPFGFLYYFTSNAPGDSATSVRRGRFGAADLIYVHLPYAVRNHIRGTP